MGEPNTKEQEFIKCVKEGNITEVKQLMKEVKVDCIGDDGMTPLMYASYKGNELMVRLLIEHGADVNIDTQKDGYTPLMFAVFSGSTEVVRLLLEQGAKKDTVNKIKRTASQLGAFVGRHDCVSIINNFVDNEQINYYTRKQGLEEEAKLPEDLAGLVHKLVVIPVLNPVKLVLFIQENKKLIDNYKNVNKVLDCECSRAYKGVNEVLSLKVHVFQHVFEQCVQWEQGVKGKDGLKGFLKFLLRGRDEDGFPINMENLLRDSFKSFPHVQSNVFKQLIRTVSPVIPGNNPTALAALTQSINGIQSADFTECCSCCGERHAAQKCSACKMVRYCQGACQKLHWFTHKKFCKHLREQYMKLKEEEERLKKEEEERAKKEEKEKKAEVNNDTENKENEKHESNTSEQNT